MESKSEEKVGVLPLICTHFTKQGIKNTCPQNSFMILFKNYKGLEKLEIILISNFSMGDGDRRVM